MPAVDVFANGATAVNPSAADAPTAGTVEVWTTMSSVVGFPSITTGVSQIRVVDPAAPTEVILVTNISGSTWTVIRAAESNAGVTATVTHTAGFTVQSQVTAASLAPVSIIGGTP